jgi:hypothetical protein
MSPLFALFEDLTAAEAIEALQREGWREIGIGDWSWVLASPDGDLACRVTPIDPAYRLFAEACLAAPANPWLPLIHELVPLRGSGFAVVMERLWPADAAAAEAFCLALGLPCDSEPGAAAPSPPLLAHDPDLAAVRALVLELARIGAERYALWGGSDVRPGNVMEDARGRMKLMDPVFVAGRSIVAAIEEGRADLLAGFSRAELEDFLTIPVFAPGAATQALRAALHALQRR